MGAQEGTGATVTFGTSGVSLRATSIQSQGLAWEAIPTTHLTTATAKTFIRGDLYDPGTINISFLCDPSTPDSAPDWANATKYVVDDIVAGTDSKIYRCFLAHTSETGVKGAPITGTAWDTYWKLATSTLDDLSTVMLNSAQTVTITYPDAATEAATGFATNVDTSTSEVDAAISGSMTIKRTGDVTFTPTPD